MVVVALTACVGDDSSVQTDSGAKDVATSDGGDGASCTPACTNPTTFHDCTTQSDLTCALGCVATGAAHCAVMQPASPVTPADLTTAGVGDLIISKLTTIHTDTGAIDGIRAANADPTKAEVVSQIGFQLFSGANVGVFTVKNFTVNDSIVAVATGDAALAIVAGDTVSLLGTLDARGFTTNGLLCGVASPSAVGPGGTKAGVGAGNPGVGAGAGNGADVGGGGGGGFGGAGGDGRKNETAPPNSVGGVTVPFALPISGGFGGGSNGAGDGGGGGGAVQLVAANQIKIGGGTKVGGVNVGGCGGYGNTNSNFPNTGGGGGGSGGEILLQSPVVMMLANGTLAANGGAGGGGGGAGAAGLFSDQPAQASASANAGGAGAAAASLNGTSVTTGSNTLGAGGGGAVGRIRIDNASGTITLAGGAILSPSMGTSATTTVKVTAN